MSGMQAFLNGFTTERRAPAPAPVTESNHSPALDGLAEIAGLSRRSRPAAAAPVEEQRQPARRREAPRSASAPVPMTEGLDEFYRLSGMEAPKGVSLTEGKDEWPKSMDALIALGKAAQDELNEVVAELKTALLAHDPSKGYSRELSEINNRLYQSSNRVASWSRMISSWTTGGYGGMY